MLKPEFFLIFLAYYKNLVLIGNFNVVISEGGGEKKFSLTSFVSASQDPGNKI